MAYLDLYSSAYELNGYWAAAWCARWGVLVSRWMEVGFA